jgi:hypothetical protein
MIADHFRLYHHQGAVRLNSIFLHVDRDGQFLAGYSQVAKLGETNMSDEEESQSGGKLSSAIGSGIKYAVLVVLLYYGAKWIGWV